MTELKTPYYTGMLNQATTASVLLEFADETACMISNEQIIDHKEASVLLTHMLNAKRTLDELIAHLQSVTNQKKGS